MKGIRKVLSGVYIENNYVNCRGKFIHFLIIVTDFKEHPKLHNLASLLKPSLMIEGLEQYSPLFPQKIIFVLKKIFLEYLFSNRGNN